jgi:predicted signal transduction protein with EAL and GGDEF domain
MLGAANCASTNEMWDGIERLGDIRASVGMRYDLAETLELAALSSCGLNEVAIDICRLREAYTGKSTALQAPLSAFAKFCRQNRIRTVVHDIASDADLLLAEACGAHAMQGDYWGLPQPPQIFGIQCGGSVPECIEPAKSVSTMRADRPRRAATQVALSSVGDQR